MINATKLHEYAQRLALILKPSRPMVFFDLESTGTDAQKDRIVQLCLIKVMPDGEVIEREHLIFPGLPIPAEATAVHGISSDMVIGRPSFSDLATDIGGFIGDSDLAGYNVLRYDVPLLVAEFGRAGFDFNYLDRAIIDLMVIHHKFNPRDLAAAVSAYTDESPEAFEQAKHDAAADTEVYLPVLAGQLVMHGVLPRTVKDLGSWCWGDRVDLGGKFKRDADGDIVLAFSKNAGRKLADVARKDGGFLDWMLRCDFPADVKQIVRDAQEKEKERRRAVLGMASKPADHDDFDAIGAEIETPMEENKRRDIDNPNGETTLDRIGMDAKP